MSPSVFHSCLYEGTVRHRRWRAPGVERSSGRPADVFHSLHYRLFLVYVDLAELPQLFGRRGLWSMRWPAVAWFRRADYLGPATEPLDQSVRRLVSERLGRKPTGPIRLLTSFRYAGFRMNPVSFYYCFDATGERLETLVAEVTNTPWDERHYYVLDLRVEARGEELHPRWSARNDKEFHVSPFFDMAMEYYWRVTSPSDKLLVHIENQAADGKPFDATLVARRKPLTRWNKLRVLLQYPLLTMKVAAGIYWHALRLWLKGVPYVPHPGAVGSVRTANSREPETGAVPSKPLSAENFCDKKLPIDQDSRSPRAIETSRSATDSLSPNLSVTGSIPEVYR
jgi:DUF1365 family protein